MDKTIPNQLATVEAWHTALNNKDKKHLEKLVKTRVKIGGPRGITEGVEIMLDWVDRAQIKLTPKRYFLSQNTVIAEEIGEWFSPETGQVVGSQEVASVFLIEDGFIASIVRYENLNKAFEETGLSEEDAVLI